MSDICPNCDGDTCVTPTEVRILPHGESNLHLCYFCFENEMLNRTILNNNLDPSVRWDIFVWTSLDILDHENVEEFLASYIETALWSSNDGNEPLDEDHETDDFAPETLAVMRDECNKFLYRADSLLKQADKLWENGKWTPRGNQDFTIVSQAAHDFWLTRNGHGAGFWDGDWPGELDEQLTDLSKEFGECDLYVGDDGKIYLT